MAAKKADTAALKAAGNVAKRGRPPKTATNVTAAEPATTPPVETPIGVTASPAKPETETPGQSRTCGECANTYAARTPGAPTGYTMRCRLSRKIGALEQNEPECEGDHFKSKET